MTGKKRILIVEDHPDVLENYKKNVLRAGFIVDTASTKDEAFEKIKRRTYHVAMIDVNLTDHSRGDSDDRSGIELVKRINSLGEGTKCVVISGERSSEVPVDAQEAGIDKYIIKKRIRVPDDYLNTVKQLADASMIVPVGKFGDLIACLAFPEKRWAWDLQAMSVLKCDASELSRILNDAFAPYVPILRPLNTSYSLAVDADSTSMAGAFWSKAIARPIWVAIGRKGTELAVPSALAKNAELLSSRKGSPQFHVWGFDGPSRSEFINSANDLR